jgi:hypothetical protein
MRAAPRAIAAISGPERKPTPAGGPTGLAHHSLQSGFHRNRPTVARQGQRVTDRMLCSRPGSLTDLVPDFTHHAGGCASAVHLFVALSCCRAAKFRSGERVSADEEMGVP